MFVVFREISRELFAIVASYLQKHRPLQVGLAVACVLAVIRVAVGVVSLFGAGSGHSFAYPRVYGQVLYEDGTPVPIKGLSLRFVASPASPEGQSGMNVGAALVDAESGKFDCLLRLLPDQKAEKIKVVLSLNSGEPPPSNLIPGGYADPQVTPLEAEPRGGHVVFRVAKPKT